MTRTPVEHLFVASTHDTLLVFTSVGKVYSLKVHEVPEASPAAPRQGDRQPPPLATGERVAALVAVKEFDDTHFVFRDHPRQGQEDRAVGLLEPAEQQDHRCRSRRGRRPARGPDHRR